MGLRTGDFSAEEVSKVKLRYSALVHRSAGEVIGRLDLHATHDGMAIEDVFEVRLVAPPRYPEEVPELYEIGGRTRAIARGLGITNLANVHCFPRTGRACVGVPQIERRMFPPGSDLWTYVESLAVPYLYGLSHLDRTGRWPWGESSHGPMGVLEFYAGGDTGSTRDELLEVGRLLRASPNWREIHRQLKRPSADARCPCGSPRHRPFAQCHSLAWAGLRVLAQERRRHGIAHLG